MAARRASPLIVFGVLVIAGLVTYQAFVPAPNAAPTPSLRATPLQGAATAAFGATLLAPGMAEAADVGPGYAVLQILCATIILFSAPALIFWIKSNKPEIL